MVIVILKAAKTVTETYLDLKMYVPGQDSVGTYKT